MPIDPNSIVWDDEPAPAAAQTIDPSSIVWDDAPARSPQPRQRPQAGRADFSRVTGRTQGTERRYSADETRRRAVARARAEGQGEEYRARLEADRMRMDGGIVQQGLIGAGNVLSGGIQGLKQLATSGVRKQLEVPARALNALGATDVASRYEAGVVSPTRQVEAEQQAQVASERMAAEPLQGSLAAQGRQQLPALRR